MKTISRYLIIVFPIIFFISCMPPDDACPFDEDIYSQSYVVRFRNLDTLSIRNANAFIGVYGNFDNVYYSDWGDTDKFNQWIKFYGDTAFNNVIDVYPCNNSWIYDQHEFFAQSPTVINITSNTNFDDNHLAYSSLNDVIWFISLSPIPYIESNYTNLYDWNNPTLSQYFKLWLNKFLQYSPYHNAPLKYFYPIDKLLSDVTELDMQLLSIEPYYYNCGIFNFLFISEPTLSKTHTFTLTMTDNEGKTYSAAFTKKWE